MTWHIDCFNCVACNRILELASEDMFAIEEGKVYCNQHKKSSENDEKFRPIEAQTEVKPTPRISK